MSFSASHAKSIVKDLRKSLGSGWRFLVPEVRDALLEARVFAVVRGQDAESVRIDNMERLLTMARHEMDKTP